MTDKPQSSRDAEVASLKREINALTEALEKQQWLNPVELDHVDPFERSRAPNRDPYQFTDVDREPNRGFERSVLGQDRHHHREPLGFHREHHCGRVTNSWCARELQDQRLPNPNTFPLGYDWVKPLIETHDRPYFGPPKSSGVGQPRTHHVFEPFGHFDPGLDPSLDPIHERRSDLKGDRNNRKPHNHDTLCTDRELRHHHKPVGHDRDQSWPPIFDREPCRPPIFNRPQVLDLDGFDRATPNQDHNNYNRNREPLVLDRAPRDLDHAPRDLDRAPPGFDRAPPAFNRALGFERALPYVNLAQLGFDRAPSGYDLAPPPFDREFPQTHVGHDRLTPPLFDREHHQRDQMEGDYEGDWGFHHPHGLTHELLRTSNVGQPRPNISFDPFRVFGTGPGPGPGLGLERSHNMGFDRAASSQDRNTHNSNREPWGFDQATRYQHQGNKSCDYSKYLNSGSSMPKAYGEGYDKTVFSYNEISVEQPPVYDIEVEDKIGDDEEEGITWKSMLP